MYPIGNLLGDAAAAESLVAHATKPQRGDQQAHSDIFNRILFQSEEESRFTVQPASLIFPAIQTHIREMTPSNHKFPRRQKRRSRSKPDFIQPLLFEMKPDRTISQYGNATAEEELGEHLDIRV